LLPPRDHEREQALDTFLRDSGWIQPPIRGSIGPLGRAVTQELGTALVVEDDPAVSGLVRRYLSRAGFVVHTTGNAADGLRQALDSTPDVVILDLTLPDGDGSELCRKIRELPTNGDVPVLVLSGTSDISTKLLLFALGADDYVVKPCDPMELVARVHALLRRRGEQRQTRRVGPLRVTLATGDAWLSERPLELTTGERSVLVQLARAFPGVTPRETLDNVPWRAGEAGSNVTEVLVGRLRRKIGAAGGGVEIRAVRRAGYVLRPVSVVASTA
jgi:DNA-binding response OmpR family regulator